VRVFGKEIEMKKVLLFVALIFLLSAGSPAFANHITEPAIPNDEYFGLDGSFTCDELLVNRYAYLTKEDGADKNIVDVLWIKYYVLADSINPFAVSKLTFGVSTEHWIDFDSVFMRADGHFDWYFPSTQELVLKYKTPCDIVKKWEG